jgi:hypothetical protein
MMGVINAPHRLQRQQRLHRRQLQHRHGCTHGAVLVDDGDPCTVDACNMVTGVSHAPVNVDDGNPCTVDACNFILGVTHIAVNVDDNNACTLDSCAPATGITHTPVSTDDGDPCTADFCNPATGVSHVPANVDDNNVCTIDACNQATGITHTPVSVDDGNPCTTDSCDPQAGVFHLPANVDDNNACTTDACNPATGITHTPIVCNDNSVCTADTCNPATGCVYTPGGYFSDDFSAGNAKGWTLGTQWAIGALLPNPAAPVAGNPDPTLDHTPTGDNFVAGVVLGGNTGTNIHAAYYLTSPVINLSGAAGFVYLDFWRFLNSDYPSYMNSTIEVYNGTIWTTIFTMASGVAINDAAWTRLQYDVTAYKNANFRVRWGYSIGQAGAFDSSGWNVDDVRLMPAMNCP